MADYKIFAYHDKLVDTYSEPVELVNGLYFNHKETLRTIEFYSSSQYLTGNKDAMGREKPFYEINNFRVRVAKTNTDIDVKDLRYEPDSLKFSTQAMVINRELYQHLKDINFSKTLNDMGHTRPKYGELLVKKTKVDGRTSIDVVPWKNVDVDPSDILGAPIVEKHFLLPSEIAAKSDVWYETDEVLRAFAKFNKNKPGRIDVIEITGEFPESYDPDLEETTELSDYTYKSMCFYFAVIGKKKYYLYKEDIKDIRDKYRSLPWEEVPGRAGRGIFEEGFEAQVWTNDAIIAQKNVMDLAGKVILSTDSNKVSGNAITGIHSGHIFQLEPNRTINSINLSPSALPELSKIMEQWDKQLSQSTSTYDANTGEPPPSGTPYSQTALLNQVANSPFEYQREVWGIFVNELISDWIWPDVKKRILKAHTLVADYDAEELDLIDESIANWESNQMIKSRFASKDPVTSVEGEAIKNEIKTRLGKKGVKREMNIPEKWLDVEGKLTMNITGELKNKTAVLQSLDNVLKTVQGSYNPNTDTYGILENPVLRGLFGQIVEIAGIPFSAGQLRGGGGKPSMPQPTADVSAVAPVAPVAA